MLEILLLQWRVLIWTLVSPSARIARSGDTWLEFVEFKSQNILSTIALISLIIIRSLLGAVKLTLRSTHLDLKQRRMSHALTHSSISTTRAPILPTLLNAHFGSTISIKNGTPRNMLVMEHLDTNNFYFLFLLFFRFYFTLLLFSLERWRRRHMTRKSHDKSHDVIS